MDSESIFRAVRGKVDGESGYFIPLTELEKILEVPSGYLLVNIKVIADELELWLVDKSEIISKNSTYIIPSSKSYVFRPKQKLLDELPEHIHPLGITFVLLVPGQPATYVLNDEVVIARKHKHIVAWFYKGYFELDIELG